MISPLACGRPRPKPKKLKRNTAPASPAASAVMRPSRCRAWGAVPPRKLQRQILGEILEPRLEEIFELISREIYRARMEQTINSGVVLNRRDIAAGWCGGSGGIDFQSTHPSWENPRESKAWWMWSTTPCTPPAWDWFYLPPATGIRKNSESG